jgi:hypothetical protein
MNKPARYPQPRTYSFNYRYRETSRRLTKAIEAVERGSLQIIQLHSKNPEWSVVSLALFWLFQYISR